MPQRAGRAQHSVVHRRRSPDHACYPELPCADTAAVGQPRPHDRVPRQSLHLCRERCRRPGAGIAERCDVRLAEGENHLPNFDVPAPFTLEGVEGEFVETGKEADLQIALDQLDVQIGGIRAEALASTEDAESFMTLVILLAVIVYGSALSLGAIWLVRRVAGPLDALSRSAEAMERGEPFAFVATRQDEIGGLAGTMARLHAIVEQRYAVVSAMAEQSSVLNRLSELVSYADDEDAVIRAGAAALERLVPSSGGAVALVNPSFDQLRVHSSWGESAALPDAPPPIDRPAGCPGIRRNAVHITRSAPDALSLSCEVHPLRSGSLLCVPMISHNEVIGVIHIERAEEDAFADDEVRLAGRVAEQLVFEDVSTGAENDLQRATDMARHMVTHYGMSEALGLATYDARPAPLYLNGPTLPEPRSFSERTAEAIDGEVRRLLDEARDRVTQTLRTNRETLEALAALLLEKEVVDRTMLDGLMASATVPGQLHVAAVARPTVAGAA